jgi:hypothetical protein
MTKDPNVLLTRIRTDLLALSQAVQAGGLAQASSTAPARTAATLTELITTLKELDRHLSSGGDPPSDWEVAFPARSQPGSSQPGSSQPGRDDRGADLFRGH